MAATRLIALHVNKSKGASVSMHERLAKEAAAQMDHLLSDIKQKEIRMQEIRELRMHITNYSKTRDIYTAYRKAGYSRNFFEAIGKKSHFTRQRRMPLISWDIRRFQELQS